MKKLSLSGMGAGKAGTTLCALFIVTLIHAQKINIGLNNDISNSAVEVKFNPKEMLGKALSFVDLTDERIGINLYSSVTGEAGIPVVNKATLPEVEGLFPSTSERKQALGKFLRKGLSDFEELADTTDRRTEIFRSIVAITDAFDEGASRNILMVRSDFVSSGMVVDFYKYHRNPSQLMDDEVFDEIMEAFKRDNSGELPNLSGFEVVLVTSAGGQELALWGTRFWRRAMFHFGAAEVSVRATL